MITAPEPTLAERLYDRWVEAEADRAATRLAYEAAPDAEGAGLAWAEAEFRAVALVREARQLLSGDDGYWAAVGDEAGRYEKLRDPTLLDQHPGLYLEALGSLAPRLLGDEAYRELVARRDEADRRRLRVASTRRQFPNLGKPYEEPGSAKNGPRVAAGVVWVRGRKWFRPQTGEADMESQIRRQKVSDENTAALQARVDLAFNRLVDAHDHIDDCFDACHPDTVTPYDRHRLDQAEAAEADADLVFEIVGEEWSAYMGAYFAAGGGIRIGNGQWTNDPNHPAVAAIYRSADEARPRRAEACGTDRETQIRALGAELASALYPDDIDLWDRAADARADRAAREAVAA